MFDCYGVFDVFLFVCCVLLFVLLFYLWLGVGCVVVLGLGLDVCFYFCLGGFVVCFCFVFVSCWLVCCLDWVGLVGLVGWVGLFWVGIVVLFVRLGLLDLCVGWFLFVCFVGCFVLMVSL